MSAHYSDDHVGRFVAVSSDDTETEIVGVSRAAAVAAIEELRAHRSPVVETESGRVYVIDGLRFISGYWEAL